jgi:CRP-like cAMP-binding protein
MAPSRMRGLQRSASRGVLGALGETTFSENFVSSGEVRLTSKEQCKDGGWQSFGFENQGDCVSFVATGGKNPPSGS